MSDNHILQIVPQLPGALDGVGDYALNLARALSERHHLTTAFSVAANTSVEAVDGFQVVSGLRHDGSSHSVVQKHPHVILHYVNYGYQKRGVPFRLLSVLRGLRTNCCGRLLTIFHELYGSGPPWRSVFWLRPLQIHIAREIAKISDRYIVSSEAMLEQMRQLAPDLHASVHPVFSHFGEPLLSTEQLTRRDPHRWVICGGTVLVERSLRSFLEIRNRIPEHFSPRELLIIGGNDNPAVRALLLRSPEIRSDYRPRISAEHASQMLSTCSFAWLDYFHRTDVPAAVLLKSSVFAAACAHGVITILPHLGSPIEISGDSLPGPYYVSGSQSDLPRDRGRTAIEIYEWYHRRAASEHLARGVVDALGLTA
jgi:hypothetical protein